MWCSMRSQEMLVAIRECAFVCTDLPLLLLLESHLATGAPQARLVAALREQLGDLLQSSDVEVLVLHEHRTLVRAERDRTGTDYSYN